MKKHFRFLTVIALVMMDITFSSGQKIMKIDSTLMFNSIPLEAKRNLVGRIGKYQFGRFKIVSGKAGWVTSKSKTQKSTNPHWEIEINSDNRFIPLFRRYNRDVVSETNEKLSFLFVGNEKDSVDVNTTSNIKSKVTPGSSMTTVKALNKTFIALITPRSDSVLWKMILVTQRGTEIENNDSFDGFLTDGFTTIEIRKVNNWENGKKALFCPGYEFFIDNKSIAAVQASPDTFKKRFVWLHQNLDPKMMLIVAAASASILTIFELID